MLSKSRAISDIVRILVGTIMNIENKYRDVTIILLKIDFN